MEWTLEKIMRTTGEWWRDTPHIIIMVDETDKTLEQLIENLKSKKVISKKQRVINGFDALELVYTIGKLRDPFFPEDTTYIFNKFYMTKEISFIQNGRLYNIQFKVPETNRACARYKQDLPIFEKSLQTFHISSSKNEETGSLIESGKYINRKMGFSFTPPAGWTFKEFWVNQFLFYLLNEQVLARMVMVGDVKTVFQIFVKAQNWDTREWAVVALERISMDKMIYNKEHMVKVLNDIIEVCRAEKTGKIYRNAWLDIAKRVLQKLEGKGAQGK
jgi:hypothetical protein